MEDLLNLKGLLLAFVVFVPLERLLEMHEQKLFRRNWKQDLFYAVFNGLPGLFVPEAAAYGLITGGSY